MDADPNVGNQNPAYPTEGSNTVDAPQFNDAGTQLKLESKSVRDAQQAWGICKSLEYDNKERNKRAADIQALSDGQPPHSAAGKAAKAQSWQCNTSTLWLAGVNGRVSQRLVNALISQKYVTESSLPDSYTNAKTKSDFLRSRFTSFIRGYDGNTGLVNSLCQENCLQGYSFACFLDPFTPFPTFFRQTELLVPNQSLQHARELQYFAAKRDFRLDKFIELFVDEKAAETQGYELKNCLTAANRSMPKDPRDDAQTTDFRKFVDMIDEGLLGLGATSSGERIVKTWMLFNREYDGKVSFWLIERDTGMKLRFSFKLFDRMQDCLAIYSFESANGTLHSSKGLGRKLAALAIMKEVFRCGIVDNARIGGLTLMYVSGADKTKALTQIASPFLLVDSSCKVAEHQFQVSAEEYRIIDQMIDGWAEQAVGAWLPVQLNDKGKTERTATEATIDARRENEASDIMIRRTLDQDSNRIQMSQIRACSDRNLKKARRIYEKLTTDPEADPEKLYPNDVDECNLMRFLVECMQEGITDEELRTWSKSQSSAYAHVTEAADVRGVALAKQTLSADPSIDQGQLTYAYVESLVGPDLAKKLFVPMAESTNKIEAERKQQIETISMVSSRTPVMVSPRDQHMLEIPVVISYLQNVAAPALSSANANDMMLKAAELNLNHLGQHLEAAAALGQNKDPRFAEYEKFYQGMKKQMAEVVQIREEAKVAQSAVEQGIRTEGAVVPMETARDIPGDFATDAIDPTRPLEEATA